MGKTVLVRATLEWMANGDVGIGLWDGGIAHVVSLADVIDPDSPALIEAVAHAIYTAEGPQVIAWESDADERETWQVVARAVLKALVEFEGKEAS